MSDLGPILSNPTLSYRLDPYEPGFIRHAKASQSTIQVVAHEQRNLNRLSREAIQGGRIVVRKQITYRPVIAGSYMGIAAGKTTVISVEKSRQENEDPTVEKGKPADLSETAEGEQVDQPSDLISEQKNGIYSRLEPELAQASVEELSQEEQNLRIEIRHITTEMERLEREKGHSTDATEPAQRDRELREVELELNRKRQELQRVTLAKMLKTQSELLATVKKALDDNAQAPMGMIKIAYGASGEPGGQNLDVFL